MELINPTATDGPDLTLLQHVHVFLNGVNLLLAKQSNDEN